MHLNNKTTTLTNKNQQKQKGTIYDNSFTSKPAKKCVAPRQRKLSLHTSYYVYEKNIAKILLNLAKSPVLWNQTDTTEILPRVEEQLDIKLAKSQKLAISKALESKLMVITGGPGTGKTTLVNALLKTLAAKKLNIKLCAPTGRAAKRLSESTGLEAITIHRLLEIDPAYGSFKRNEESPLLCDYLVIDETSMVDVPLFYSLLKAIPLHSALLLVGDVDQLPSVGAGQVLKDIISSRVISTVQLTEIFRHKQQQVRLLRMLTL